MKSWIWRSAVVFAVCGPLLGCVEQPSPTYSTSAGSLAISRDDALLFAVDSDNETVSVIDSKSEAKVADVKVGRAPERIVASKDNVLYVSNRGSRSVSVVAKIDGQWGEVDKVDVGVEPVGLALSPDEKTLYVVNSTSLDDASVGTVTAIDTHSLQVKWDLPVGEEPRGIALIENGGKALVSLYKKGDVVTVDLKGPKVERSNLASGTTPLHDLVNATQVAPSGSATFTSRSSSSTFQARSAGDVVVTPHGDRAFVPVIWSREDAITAKPSVFGGYYASGGPCNLGAIATPGIVTVQTSNSEPLVDDLTSCSVSTNSDSRDFPPTTLGTPNPSMPIQGPTVAVVDPSGEWLYVVNRDSDNVAILPTARRTGTDLDFGSTGTTVRNLVSVGASPTGIALSHDGRHAYVYSAFDHSISKLEGRGEGDNAQVVRAGNDIKVAADVLPQDVVIGRKLFFSARDSQMTNPTTGVSCNTCHESGREDGHTWVFPDGPRQTPSLAGRMLEKTAPYHWSGEFATLADFMDHTIRLRMGGTNMSAATVRQISAYLSSLELPDNPNRQATLTPEQQRGAQVFQKAQCNSCHSGVAFTNNENKDVGTLVKIGDHVDTNVTTLNVPSLLGVARTAPYLHDGSAGTLKDRLQRNPSNLHGDTRSLTDGELNDLVAYLNTL